MASKKGLEGQINSHFMRRWKDHIGKQYGVIRSVVDLAVLLYIVVPAMLVIGRSYYVLWVKELPVWLMELPYPVIPILLYSLIYFGGGLMTYQESADALFLRQNERWRKGIVWRGIAASLVAQALVWGLIVLFLLPLLLRVYAMNGAEIWLLYAVVTGVKAVAMLSENMIAIHTARWRIVLYQSLAQLGLGGLFVTWALTLRQSWSVSLLIALILLLTVIWLSRVRMHTAGRFEAEIRLEEYQKTRLTGMVLSGAVSSPRKAKARPWIFRRSNQLFKSRNAENRIAEANLKAFYRGRDFSIYIQFIGVGLVAVAIPPFPVNAVVFCLLTALLYYWLNGFRKLFLERDLLAILPMSPVLKRNSARACNRLLLQPAILIIAAGFGVSIFDAIWGIALGIAAAFALYMPYIAKMLLR
ncbi:ABC transporter permease [Paenibacillus bouchesdurhonensis]|uniref:ABC transporter permease n=1 Tax=Paenibacillus bouchesdurhonensis TaxID=1870990 RepID=UPI000DA63670|nr:ABC transporter permease [Paenibacillus bouchesdurhonensis]